MTQFLILIGLGAMVWAGGVTLLYIMACRELGALKRKTTEIAKRATFYSEYCDRQDEEIDKLRLDNARLGSDLFLSRSYVHGLRVKAGEISPDGRLLPKQREVTL